MKLSLTCLITAALTIVGTTSAAEEQELDKELFAQAFGAVQSEHDGSKWKDFLVEGPPRDMLQVDPTDGSYKGDKDAANADNAERELWYNYPPKKGWYAIDTDGGSLEVRNRNNDECFGVGEGIGKDGWKFGITHAFVPGTNMTEVDNYLMLFEEWHPYKPVYKWFKGAKK